MLALSTETIRVEFVSVASSAGGVLQVIAKWKERGWMIGTRGSKGVGYIHVTVRCLLVFSLHGYSNDSGQFHTFDI